MKIKWQQLITRQVWKHSLECHGHTPIWVHRDIKPINIDLIKVPDFGDASCGETRSEISQDKYPFIKYFILKHWIHLEYDMGIVV